MTPPVSLRTALTTLALGWVIQLGLPAHAEKPEWAGNKGGGKHGAHEKQEKHRPAPRDDRHAAPRPQAPAPGGVSVNIQIGGYFGDAQRLAVRDYYAPRVQAGNCPPGLAKKNNGCMPPGQAKKWRVGRPLPHDVVYYPVPSGISVQIGLPPAGHKYVRVAADILLIAIGTGMVVDAIEDLGRL